MASVYLIQKESILYVKLPYSKEDTIPKDQIK